MNTRKLLTTGATAVVAVLVFGTDAYAFGRRGGGCCGGGGYPAYYGGCYGSSYGAYSGGCYGSGYGGYYAPYSGGCYGSSYGYGMTYAGPAYASYATVGGPGSYSGAAVRPVAVTPAAGVVVQSSPGAVVPAAAVVPEVVVPAGGVVPSAQATYPAGYGGFSSWGPGVVPAGVWSPYSVPYGGVTTEGVILNYGTTRTGRGLFRR